MYMQNAVQFSFAVLRDAMSACIGIILVTLGLVIVQPIYYVSTSRFYLKSRFLGKTLNASITTACVYNNSLL